MAITVHSRTRYKTTTTVTPTATTETSTPPPKPSVCVYRGDRVGKAVCGCQGSPVIYRCNVLRRPNHDEAAFCSSDGINRPVVDIYALDGSKVHSNVEAKEIATCRPSMCDMFKVGP
jgi:uncharacterized protein YqiB (DUF1249 family)